MLSVGRSEAERQKSSSTPSKPRQEPEWGIPSSEMAAQLSSPDAFNRALLSQANAPEASGRLNSFHQFKKERGAPEQGSEPATPTTPKLGELMRQRNDSNTDTDATPQRVESTRIMVTKPIEVHGEGSADSDSEEEDYDRERQHSVMPHPAGASPFGSKVLKRFPQQGLEEEGPAGSLGWQDVGLESDEEASSRLPGHIFAEGSGAFDSQNSGESQPALRLELRPSHSAEAQDQQGHAEIELEEVLPRPQAGLLNRLLRLARVERVGIPGQPPAFVVHPGKEYMVGLKLKYLSESGKSLSAKWIRIQPPDGQPVRFNVEEESSKAHEWSGSACWDTSLHSSEALGGDKQALRPQSIPIQVTIGLEASDVPGKRIEAVGQLYVILYAALHSRKSGEDSGSSPAKLSPVASFCLL